jgi:hypothetical protein
VSGNVKVGKNTAVEKAVSGLPTFSSWSSETIEQRQAALANLSQRVWDMPGPKGKVAKAEKADKCVLA